MTTAERTPEELYKVLHLALKFDELPALLDALPALQKLSLTELTWFARLNLKLTDMHDIALALPAIKKLEPLDISVALNSPPSWWQYDARAWDSLEFSQRVDDLLKNGYTTAQAVAIAVKNLEIAAIGQE